jgi:hypothetical protein
MESDFDAALHNNAVNATVLASRRLQGKRRATRPARYRERYPDYGSARTE